MEENNHFRILAETKLPISTGKVVDAIVFGTADASPDVIALINKEPNTNSDKTLVRLHSACITSEVLQSSKCDCADQLNMSIERICESDWGIVIYLLKHEGRGIGLVNKIHAYSLQAKGFDTVDANLKLGFGADDRDFYPAVASLRLLGVKRIELMSNNPQKVKVLCENGFDVVKRIAMDVNITENNRGYLETKQEYFGHQPARCPSTELLTLESAILLFKEDSHITTGLSAALSIQLIGTKTDARVMEIAKMIRSNSQCNSLPAAKTEDNHFVILIHSVDSNGALTVANSLLSDIDTRREKAKIGLATFDSDEDIEASVVSLNTAIEQHIGSNERIILTS